MDAVGAREQIEREAKGLGTAAEQRAYRHA
jgi:hypothetical protein